MSSVEVIGAGALAGIPHGFLGRRGGVSIGEVAGLNVGIGSNDDRAAIDENRRRAVAAIKPGSELVTVHQVHSAKAVYATEAWAVDARPRADAIVTDRPGLLLGILTADCAPILLADAEAGVIGAAHAGWRGAVGGVAEAVVAAMVKLGARAERIAAAVGPCIACESYEVGGELIDRLIWADPDHGRYIAGQDDEHGDTRLYFDLPEYVRARLERAGVGAGESLNLDTYADPDRFFSYRRSTHRGQSNYGRQLSAIALP